VPARGVLVATWNEPIYDHSGRARIFVLIDRRPRGGAIIVVPRSRIDLRQCGRESRDHQSCLPADQPGVTAPHAVTESSSTSDFLVMSTLEPLFGPIRADQGKLFLG
jgi:hypothetical protein